MPETINSWLARQLKDPEFAKEYRRVSVEMDEQLAAVQTARSTLAQKVLAVGYAVARGRKEDDIAYDNAVNHVLSALRELFQREGVEVKL